MGKEDRDLVGWHLDKRVPIGLIITVLLQTTAFGWFLSDVSSQVEINAKAIEANRTDIKAVEERNGKADVTLGRIEIQLTNLAQVLTRIEDRINETD